MSIASEVPSVASRSFSTKTPDGFRHVPKHNSPRDRLSVNRRAAAGRRSSNVHSSRRGTVSIRSNEQIIEEKKGPNVESVLTDVMRAYMSLELELVDEAQVSQLATALRTNTSVTSVNLSYNTAIKDSGLVALSEALMKNTTVVQLNLSGCTGFSDVAAATMLANLDDVYTLKSLSLSGCVHVGDQFAAQLAESIENSSLQLRDVNMSGCKALSDQGGLDIGNSLLHAAALKTLMLQGCVLLTDRTVIAIAHALRFSPSLEVLNLSWCEELTDDSAVALADSLLENRYLNTLLLSCCLLITDVGGKALASSLESNKALTTLDLSWITTLGVPTLTTLTQSMVRNRTLTTLNLTGCKCMKQLAAENARLAGAPAPAPDRGTYQGRRGQRTSHESAGSTSLTKAGPNLTALLQRNRNRPKSLAASAIGGSDKGGISLTAGQNSYGRRGLITTPEELLRTLRATIINGAALYNAEDAEGCLNLFMQTAESVEASTKSPGIAEAILKVTRIDPVPQKLWLLRSAFDELVDELVDNGIES